MVARAQHGVVTAAQLLEAGLSYAAISKRAKAGRLHRLHRGVYAVAHEGFGAEGRWMAAVLACGEGAVLSHVSAAVLWDLLRPLDGPVHVSVPTSAGRRHRAGIVLHRRWALSPSSTTGLERRQVTLRRGIPVTTPARTIADLPGTVPPVLARRARRQAEFRGLSLAGIESDRTRSDLEAVFLEICGEWRLPPVEVNVPVGRWTVDFLWRAERLAVETDGYAAHRGSTAFHDDHARDLDLRRAGFTVLRFSELQLEAEPEAVAEDVGRALRRGRS